MADVTASSKKAVREALIQFFVSVSGTMKEAYCFTVRGRYNEMSLSTLMFLTPEEYAATLLIAGLVHVTQAGIIWCKKNVWNEFVAEVPNFDSVELRKNCVEITKSQINTNAFVRRITQCSDVSDTTINKKLDILRIGVLPEGETVKASLQYCDGIRPPSRFLLRSAQRDLKEGLYPHIQELIRINDSKLLSVMKWVDIEQLRERLPVAAANVPAPEITTTTTTSTTTDSAIENERSIDFDVATRRESMTDAEKLAQTMYPSLFHYGLSGMIDGSGDPATVMRNKAMMSGILTDILKFHVINNKPVGITSWSTSGVIAEYIAVPESLSEDDFNRNAKRTGWFEEVLDKCGSDDHSAIHNIMQYLLQRHEKFTTAALTGVGVIPKILTAYEVAAIMVQANLGTTQWRNLAQCLKTFLGLNVISVSEKMWMLIGHDHGVVSSGCYDWQKVEGHRTIPIHWWTMDPESELLLWLCDGANGDGDDLFDPTDIASIFVIFSGDHHGKGKHRFVFKVVVRSKKRGKW